jgi:choline dehydrogenase-like flavoprotein
VYAGRSVETSRMIDDLNRLETDRTFRTDLCLIGAGAAGITIARELSDSRLNVCLVESGDFDEESDTQTLCEGESIGRYCNLEASRLRMFGGTTNHWTGRCATLDPLDFAARDWVPHSGWPIDKPTLETFYRRARAVCGFETDWRSDEETRRTLGITLPPLKSPWLQPFLWRFATMQSGAFWNWGIAYREALRQAKNIRVLLHANLTRIATNEDGRQVEVVTVTSLTGVTLRIEARAFVLCCGGIENARLLLIGGEQNPALPANRHDVVGRYFQQHPRGRSALMVTADQKSSIQDAFNNFALPGQVHCEFGLALSERAQREQRLLNCSAVLRYQGDPESGWVAAKDILRELKAGRWAPDIGEKVWFVTRNLDELAVNVRRHLAGLQGFQLLRSVEIVIDLEQAPNPDSRITLSEERDQLGLPKAKADWRLTSFEQRTAKAFTLFIAAEFARLGIGRCRLDPWVEEGATIGEDEVTETFHHVGATRMAANPRDGVVDKNCRVHGTENLFVAGSSVFPTGGHANPTLTIVALAVRLSDHLKTGLT